jgi:hypothetical protein
LSPRGDDRVEAALDAPDSGVFSSQWFHATGTLASRSASVLSFHNGSWIAAARNHPSVPSRLGNGQCSVGCNGLVSDGIVNDVEPATVRLVAGDFGGPAAD